MKRSHSDLEGRPRDAFSYIEFYAGVGGWTMALQEAVQTIYKQDEKSKSAQPSLYCCAALDHSDLCVSVYQHNHHPVNKTARIEKLTIEQLKDWNALIWMMSPPCQPHTRQHANQAQDLEDPRSRSFLHLCDLLEQVPEDALPELILLENVVGFEESGSCQRWRQVLAGRGYGVGHFHLTPTQVDLPNDRPRYYCVAVLRSQMQEESMLRRYVKADPPEATVSLHTSLEELNVVHREKTDDSLPPLRHFLNNNLSQKEVDSLRIPESILKRNAAWCFDIVTPESRRSACFTSSYGKFVKGSGSVLYTGNEGKQFELTRPEDRQFDETWAEGLDLQRDLRYCSGMELARLFGFSDGFSFPQSISLKQQWKLIGNSLNVRVAARLTELGLRLLRKNHVRG